MASKVYSDKYPNILIGKLYKRFIENGSVTYKNHQLNPFILNEPTQLKVLGPVIEDPRRYPNKIIRNYPRLCLFLWSINVSGRIIGTKVLVLSKFKFTWNVVGCFTKHLAKHTVTTRGRPVPLPVKLSDLSKMCFFTGLC